MAATTKKTKKPKVGTEQWESWADRVLQERDELRRENQKLKSEEAARDIVIEAELTNLKRASHDLCAVLRNIINNPLSPRIDVQSKLTLAMQRFEREMGEDF